MKILLINQPFRTDTPRSIFRPDMPRNLIVLAGCLRADSHEVKIHDMPVLNAGYDSIPPLINSFKPNMVCMCVHAACFFPRVKKCLEEVKKANKNLPIVVGGIVPTMLRERVFKILPEVDIIVLGEGEEVLVEIAKTMEENGDLEKVKGLLIKKKDDKIVQTGERPFLQNLDNFPRPAYDLLPMEEYCRLNLPLFIETQRGCPFNCKFCGANFPTWKGSVRYKDPIKVVDEIEYVVNTFGLKNVSFCDETFTLNRPKVITMLNEIIKRNLGIKWIALTRVDRLDDELLALMKKAGCQELGLGIEVGSQESLGVINKKTSLDQNENGIRMVENAGIRARAFIVIGFPHATHNDIYKTLEFLYKTKPSVTTFFVFTPTPGTEYFNEPEKFGISINIFDIEDWMKFDYFDVPLSDTPYLTTEDIIKYYILYSYIIPSKFNPKRKFNERVISRLLHEEMPRKKKGVVLLFDGNDAFYYNPNLPKNMPKADLFRSTFCIDKKQYEVLLRCNGDFTVAEITDIISRLFETPKDEAEKFVLSYLKRCEELNLIYKLRY